MSQSGVYTTSGGGGGGTVITLTGNAGGAVGPNGGGNINVVGAGGVTVTGNPGTNTLTITDAGGGITWFVATVNAGMAINDGYIANGGAGISLLLPAVAPVGSIVRVTGINAGGWTITQNGGQTIFVGNAQTTVGVGGSVASTLTRDSIELVCVVANTTWNTLSGVGNFNVT
jgi:hypothetical protein